MSTADTSFNWVYLAHHNFKNKQMNDLMGSIMMNKSKSILHKTEDLRIKIPKQVSFAIVVTVSNWGFNAADFFGNGKPNGSSIEP
jgi:hypothetical protein